MHFKKHFICFDKKSPYFEHENYFWPQKLEFETLCSVLKISSELPYTVYLMVWKFEIDPTIFWPEITPFYLMRLMRHFYRCIWDLNFGSKYIRLERKRKILLFDFIYKVVLFYTEKILIISKIYFCILTAFLRFGNSVHWKVVFFHNPGILYIIVRNLYTISPIIHSTKLLYYFILHDNKYF